MAVIIDEEFNPARLGLARRRRGHTKQSLSKLAKVTPRRLGEYEAGECPPVEVSERLAEALQVPVEFLRRESYPEPTPDVVSFRSFARLSATHRSAALAAAAIGFEFAARVDELLELPPVDLPDVSLLDPRAAALAVRSEWGLGDLPLPNVVQLLEAKGVRVLSLVDEVKELDAFSVWDRGLPFIFLTHHKSPERARWDVCHELGHLILHVGGVPQGREVEREADEFASEFLMPTAGVSRRLPRFPTMLEVRHEKAHWKVSALAYIRRLFQLGAINEWVYRGLVIEATKAGYRREEGDIERELSGLWPKALEILSADGIGLQSLARDLCVHTRELRELTFSALAPAAGTDEARVEPPRRPQLRLV